MTDLMLVQKFIDNINTMTPEEIRQTILDVEQKMLEREDAVVGDACPLIHNFGEGLYVREILMPPGFISTTKIHKYSHPAFILRGEVLIIEEQGAFILTGPCYMMTKPKTKRIVVCKTEVSWVTVHHTHSKDLGEIEKEIILTSFDEEE